MCTIYVPEHGVAPFPGLQQGARLLVAEDRRIEKAEDERANYPEEFPSQVSFLENYS